MPERAEQQRRKRAAKGTTASVHALSAEVMGTQIGELLSARAAPEPPIDSARVLYDGVLRSPLMTRPDVA